MLRSAVLAENDEIDALAERELQPGHLLLAEPNIGRLKAEFGGSEHVTDLAWVGLPQRKALLALTSNRVIIVRKPLFRRVASATAIPLADIEKVEYDQRVLGVTLAYITRRDGRELRVQFAPESARSLDRLLDRLQPDEQ
jgi:hypothetical protein